MKINNSLKKIEARLHWMYTYRGGACILIRNTRSWLLVYNFVLMSCFSFLFGFSFQVIYCECDPFPLSAGSFIRLISSTTVKSALKASSIKAFPLEQTCSGCLPHSLTSSGAVSDSK